jgi:2-amino-4-hydroxy-6-hydroxymethyldihydropteridine diphosphokinase
MEENNNIVYLHTGSNLGDRFKNLKQANALIEQEIGKIIQVSSLYETEAWGYRNQPSFINQAICVETQLSPIELMQTIYDLEIKMGRVRVMKWAERLIDIDILFYNQTIIEEPPTLIIPHPRISERNFVMAPLAEIAPSFLHPVLNQSIQQLLDKSTDTLAAKKILDVPEETIEENLIFAQI